MSGHAVALADDHLAPVVGERGVLGEGGALDAGNVGEAILQLAVHGVELRHGVRGPGRDDAEDDAVVDVVAEVLMLEVGEGAGEQARAGEQDDGEGGLDDDEGFLRPGGVIAGAAIGAAESFDGIGVGGEPCGRGSEDGTGDEREREGKGEDGQRRRGGDGHEVRAVEGEGDDGFDAEVRDGESGDAAEDGEEDAFGEGLADEALARRAEGKADGGLGAARGSAGEEEVGDVGAGDEENEAADGEQDVEACRRSPLSFRQRRCRRG